MDPNIKKYILKKLGGLAHPHKKRLILTLIVTYFLGLAFIAIFYEGQFLSIRYLSQNEIFWIMTLLWTAAWIAALISGRFTRIRNGLGILLGIWSYIPDRMPAIDLLGQVGNAAVQELINAMKNGEPTVRATAVEILGKIKDVQTVPYLTLAMKNDKCIDVRRAAAESLGQIGDALAVPDLILELKDNNSYSEMRYVAARALGQIGDIQAVPDLIQMLKDGDSSICEAAAEALGQIGDVRAVPDLIQILEKDNKFIGKPVAIALGRIGDPQAVLPLIREMDQYSSFSLIASEALGQIGLPAMPYLFEKLMWSDKYVRDNAASALRHIFKESALRHIFKEVHEQIETDPVKALNNGNPLLRWCVVAGVFGKIKDLNARSCDLNIALKEALKDDNWTIRRGAAEALGEILDVQAMPDLILALKNDESMLVRFAAAETLGQIRADGAVPDLIQALKEENAGLRMTASESLGKIGDARAVQYLILALNKDTEWSVRYKAAISLGQIHDVEAVPHLIRALNDKNEHHYVRSIAARALGQIGGISASHGLIQALKEDGAEDVRRAAVESLGEIGDAESVPDLIQVMKKDGDENVRRSATESLGKIGDHGSVPDLIQALKDNKIYYSASNALAKIRDSKSIPSLIALLEDDAYLTRVHAQDSLSKLGISAFPDLIRALKNSDDRIRSHARKSLDRIKDPPLQDLIQLLDDENSNVREFAVEAMKRTRDADAVPYLFRAMKDSDGSVRSAAAYALGYSGDTDAVPYLIQAINDSNGYVRIAATTSLDLLAGKIKSLSDARSVCRALRWKLTDQIFDRFEPSTVFHALDQAASRLDVLEMEAMTAEDPLSRPELIPHSKYSRYIKMAYFPIISSLCALLLQIIYRINTNQITDLNEGIAFLTRNPLLTVLAIFLGAVVFLSQYLYSRIIKEER